MNTTIEVQHKFSCNSDEVREAIAYLIESTADWRDRKAQEYPDDRRNARAVEDCKDLLKTVLQIEESICQRYFDAWEVDACKISEVMSRHMRCIGFSSLSTCAQSIVEDALREFE